MTEADLVSALLQGAGAGGVQVAILYIGFKYILPKIDAIEACLQRLEVYTKDIYRHTHARYKKGQAKVKR